MLYLLVALGSAALAIVFVVSRIPSDFSVTRTIPIAAPPEAVFAEVNDLRRWKAWSPWVDLDPAQVVTFAGPESGTGASMAWVGNNQVGAGKMTVTESHPGEAVRFRLDFEKPFRATNLAEFTFRTEAGRTVVAWSMTGQSPFFFKAMSLLMNCRGMIQGQFDKGLSRLKAIAEAKK